MGIKRCIFGAIIILILSAKYSSAQLVFGTPRELTEVNSPSSGDWSPSLSANGLELYFMGYDRPGGSGTNSDLWVAARDTTADSFGTPVNLGSTINKNGADSNPDISEDGLTLFFDSQRAGGFGDRDLWMTTRANLTAPWEPPINLGPLVNTRGWEGRPTVTADGLVLVYDRNHDRDENTLWMATRESTDDSFGSPVSLGIAGASAGISHDGLLLLFHARGEYGAHDIFMVTRATRTDPFGDPVNLGMPVNTALSEGDPDLALDGSALYFVRVDPDAPNFLLGTDLWVVPLVPEPSSTTLLLAVLIVVGYPVRRVTIQKKIFTMSDPASFGSLLVQR